MSMKLTPPAPVAKVGAAVGDGVGVAVGSGVGVAVGDNVGAAVGSGVGTGVGACVATSWRFLKRSESLGGAEGGEWG